MLLAVEGVFYVPKKQGIAWHALSRIAAGAMVYNLLELVGRNPVSSNLYQRSHNGTNHVAKKTVGCYYEAPLPCFFYIAANGKLRVAMLPTSLCQVANGGLVVAPRLAKAFKVVLTYKVTCSFVHSVIVQYVRHFARISLKKWVSAMVHVIVIGARCSRKACVQLVSNRKHGSNGNIARQQAVQLVA